MHAAFKLSTVLYIKKVHLYSHIILLVLELTRNICIYIFYFLYSGKAGNCILEEISSKIKHKTPRRQQEIVKPENYLFYCFTINKIIKIKSSNMTYVVSLIKTGRIIKVSPHRLFEKLFILIDSEIKSQLTRISEFFLFV